MTVVDFAFGRPTPASLKAAGVTGVLRYTSSDPAKAITLDEYRGYVDAGIAVGLVYEDGAMDWTSVAAGQAKARIAIPILTQIKWPLTRPVYAAVDENLPAAMYSATYSSIAAFAVAIGHPTAVYGPRPFLLYCDQTHNVEWLWEVASADWNTGAEPKNKRLQQLVGGGPSPIGGADVDYDTAIQKDWGQTPAPLIPAPPTPNPPKPPPAPTPPPTEDTVTHHSVKVGPIPANGEADIAASVTYANISGIWIEAGAGPNDTGHVSAIQSGANTVITVRGATPGTTQTVIVATVP